MCIGPSPIRSIHADYVICNIARKILMARKQTYENIAGRLPENSRNSFVDLQSQKTVIKTDQEIRLFIAADMLLFWLKICINFCCLY